VERAHTPPVAWWVGYTLQWKSFMLVPGLVPSGTSSWAYQMRSDWLSTPESDYLGTWWFSLG